MLNKIDLFDHLYHYKSLQHLEKSQIERAFSFKLFLSQISIIDTSEDREFASEYLLESSSIYITSVTYKLICQLQKIFKYYI